MGDDVRTLALGMLLLLTAAAPLSGQSPAVRPELHPGDIVKITVWQRPELTGEFTVAADGTLIHPLYQEIVVTGIPIPEVTERIGIFLRRFEADPRFVVEPSITVAALGAFRRPDIHKLPPGTTLEGVVTVAGGLADNAKPKDAHLVRDGRERDIDLRPGSNDLRMLVLSGDQVRVEPKTEGGILRTVTTVLHSVGAIASIIRLARR